MAAKFGQYDIIEKLGEGGMGTVHKARYVPSGRIVALKRLTGFGAFSKDARERFMVEARAMARLRHRNIVAVHEVDQVQSVPFFAMDYVNGRSLLDIIREEVPDERRAARWMAKIALAVDHAHNRGIIHRDLKPANVIIDADDEPVVMDFGLAKDILTDIKLTAADEIVGTPSYMSPEQVNGQPLDARSDVFALGAILYSLLTAEAPFKGPISVVMFKVAHKDPEAPSQINADVSPAMETICLKAMRKAPEDRYESAAAMAEDLGAFLTETRIKARPESRVASMFRAIGRRKPALVSALLCALLGIGGALLFLQLRPESLPPSPVVQSDGPAADANPMSEIDAMVASKQYDEALGRCRELLQKTSDQTLQEQLNRRMQWIQALQRASAGAGAPAPGAGAASPVAQEIAQADGMLLRGEYDNAISLYEGLLAGSLEDADRDEVQQRTAWAKQLQAQAGQPAEGSSSGGTGQTVADGDRLVAACKFEEAVAIYQTADADQARLQMANRLITLRSRAAAELGQGAWRPVTLQDDKRLTLVSINRTSAVVADAGGTVNARSWDALQAADVYRIYQSCLSDPTAADRLNLGILCMGLGLSREARNEFDQAASLDGANRAEADRFLALQLSR